MGGTSGRWCSRTPPSRCFSRRPRTNGPAAAWPNAATASTRPSSSARAMRWARGTAPIRPAGSPRCAPRPTRSCSTPPGSPWTSRWHGSWRWRASASLTSFRGFRSPGVALPGPRPNPRTDPVYGMLVDTQDEQSEAPSAPTPHSHLRVRSDLHEEYSPDEIAKMTEMYEGTLSNIEEGEIVKSKVLRVTDAAVILDVGFKSEGAVPIDEFKDAHSLKEGDEAEVFLEHLEDQEGAVVLSKKKADFMRVWERIREAHEKDEAVSGTLVKKIKGGVVVDLMGVDAFLPGSQIALRRVANIHELLGQSFDFKIIKLNKRRRNIVVSRRVLLEAERKTKRDVLMKELQVGQVRKGIVKNITDFGAFIDLGGVDGLLHITDMSYGRVSHPSEMVKIGQEVEVKVLDIDWERERISLGLKQLQAYPWKNVAAKYPVGTRVQGKVVSITNYGAFVELEPGIEGLWPISEMSWTRNVRHPSKIVSIGETIEAVVLKVDETEEKVSLGMKQTEEDPWMALPQKYPVGM